MTILAKLLVFLCLILGIGMAVASTSAYSQRPAWFNPVGETPDKGQLPLSFAQLGADIKTAGDSAITASNVWGAKLRLLDAAEKTRAERLKLMFGPDGLLAVAHKGKASGGFYNLKEDPLTRLLDLKPDPKMVVNAPDGLPLKGSDTLLERFNADADAVTGTPDAQGNLKGGLAQQIDEYRARQLDLGSQVVAAETRLLKQREIKDNLLNEASYLGAYEVNVAEQRDTVTRRRTQLRSRLTIFSRN